MRRLSEERGVAIVVAMLVMMVLASLALTAIQLSLHTSAAANYDQRWNQSFQAADTGLAKYLSILPDTGPKDDDNSNSTYDLCDANGQTVSLGTQPVRSYVLTISLYDSTGAKVGCTSPAYAGQAQLRQAVIRATAVAGTATASSATKTRVLEEKVNLTAVYGADTTQALYGGQKVIISNNVNINYNLETNDADIYSGGDVVVNNYLDLQGDIYAQGSVTFKGCIEGSIWAKGAITGMAAYVGACNSAPQPGADVQNGVNIYPGYGYVTSSASSVILPSNTWAYGSCTATTGQTITVSYCSKYKKPSKPNTPAACGTDDPAGDNEPCGVHLATVPDPPTITFPKLTFAEGNWVGYKFHRYTSCANATSDFQDYLNGTTPSRQASGDAWSAASVANDNHVFEVNVDCAMNPASSSTYTLKGNVAVMLRGLNTASFEAAGQFKVANSGSTTHALFIETPWAVPPFSLPWTAPATIAAKCLVQGLQMNSALQPYNHRFSTKTDFSSIHLFDYTPCDILSFNQNKSGMGQFVAGEFLYVNNSFTLGYLPIDNPDVLPTGYTAAPVYVRELKS